MRRFGMFVGVLSLALVSWACDGQPMCGGELLDNGETTCPDEPGDKNGTDGGWRPDQFRDEHGICRSDSDQFAGGCAPTFDLALSAPPRCGPVCAGTCGKWLVLQDNCTPSFGCTYDPASRALVGVVWGDDVPDNCGGSSYTVTYGDGYHGCQFTDLIVSDGCYPGL